MTPIDQDILRDVEALLSETPQTSATTFLAEQFRRGLGWISFPEGRGGRGANADLQAAIRQRLVQAGAPDAFERNPLGYGMAGPMLIAHASAAQLDRFLQPLFTGEEIWCQLFSEPGAGSDLADVATTARRDGDDWIVTGQKVWTSFGHLAKWGMLLARTDPSVPKHKGMTYFICDMHAAGVDVQPIRQITGASEFNAVYLDEVRIPDAHRVGEVGQGWQVALTTLNSERYTLSEGLSALTSLRQLLTEHHVADVTESHALARLQDLAVEVLATERLKERSAVLRAKGVGGAEGALAKLATTELNKAVNELRLDLQGPYGSLCPPGYDSSDAPLGSDAAPALAFLRSQANTIEGGTSDILRNTIAERILGLPGEPRVDRDVPWTDIPRTSQHGRI